MSKEHAETLGYFAVTTGYAIRQHDQCDALQKAADQLRGMVDFLLVKEGTRISIWRKKPNSR